MDMTELKRQLIEAGAKEEALAKIDFDKVDDIVSNASSIDDLCKKMKVYMPDFDPEAFKKELEQAKEESSDSEAEIELSDDSLASVAGGSKAGDWFKKNREWVLPLAITAGGLATLGVAKLITKPAGLSSWGKYAKNKMQSSDIDNGPENY